MALRSCIHALLLVATVLAVALPAAAQPPPPDPLKFRPPGCNAATCEGCREYVVSLDNTTDTIVGPTNPCGDDGAFFPVPVAWTANCQQWWGYTWICVPSCSAGCAPGATQWQGQIPGGGKRNATWSPTFGCAACPGGAEGRLLELPSSTCRSCFRSRTCKADTQPSRYRVCLESAARVGVVEPAPAPEQPVLPPTPAPAPAPEPVAAPVPAPAPRLPAAALPQSPPPPSAAARALAGAPLLLLALAAAILVHA